MVLTNRFDHALQYAVVVHAGQLRKGSDVPYISHLLVVAGLALDYGADEDEAIAALLHDAVEDGGGVGRADDIRHRFGARVADIVMGCTDTVVTPKPPTAERRRAHLLYLSGETNPSVLLVSACDKLANVRSILKDHRVMGDKVFGRFNVGKADTLNYYHELAEIFASQLQRGPAVDLKHAVAELTQMVGD
jgi:GTP pyrophosphokinase